MPETKLKPCPFCGGKVTTKISVSASCTQIKFAVYCHSCEIKQCHSILNGDSFDEAEKAMIKAIELWNRRAENETN